MVEKLFWKSDVKGINDAKTPLYKYKHLSIDERMFGHANCSMPKDWILDFVITLDLIWFGLITTTYHAETIAALIYPFQIRFYFVRKFFQYLSKFLYDVSLMVVYCKLHDYCECKMKLILPNTCTIFKHRRQIFKGACLAQCLSSEIILSQNLKKALLHIYYPYINNLCFYYFHLFLFEVRG